MSQSDDECGRRRADHDIQSSPDKKEVDRSKEGKEGKECKEKETKKKPSDVCRDYLRNVCKRKKHCKFTHPAGRKGTEVSKVTAEEISFCHDFQNTSCARVNCRFVHCTRGEEDTYREKGKTDTEKLVIGYTAVEKDDVPLCKDFIKGDCRRDTRCKFVHVPTRALTRALKGGDRNTLDGGDGDEEYDDLDTAERLLKRRRMLQREQRMEMPFNGNERKDNYGVGVKKNSENFHDASNYHLDSREGHDMSGLRRIDHLLMSNDGILPSRLSLSPSQENYDPHRPSTPSDDFSFNFPSPSNGGGSSSRDYYDSLLSSCANQATRNNGGRGVSNNKRPKLDYNAGNSTSPTQNYFKSVNAASGQSANYSALTSSSSHGHQLMISSSTYGSRSSPGASTKEEMTLMESENRLLRKRVEELKKQVADLTATNEFLLDQNARFRMQQQQQQQHPQQQAPAPQPRLIQGDNQMTSQQQQQPQNLQNQMTPIMSQNISAALMAANPPQQAPQTMQQPQPPLPQQQQPMQQQSMQQTQQQPMTQTLNAAIVGNQVMTPSSSLAQNSMPMASSSSVMGSNMSSCLTTPMSTNIQQNLLPPPPPQAVAANPASIPASQSMNTLIPTQNISAPMTSQNIQAHHVAAQVQQAQQVAVQQAQQVAAQAQQVAVQQAQQVAVQQAQQVAAHAVAQVQQAQVAAQVQQAQHVAAQVQQAQQVAQHVAAHQQQAQAATIAASVPNVAILTQSISSFNTSRGPGSISSSYPSNTNCTSQNASSQPQPSAPLSGKPMMLSTQSGGAVVNTSLPITVACSIPASLNVMNPPPPCTLSVSHASLGPQNCIMSMGPLMSAQLALASVGASLGLNTKPMSQQQTIPAQQQQQMNPQIQATSSANHCQGQNVRSGGPGGPAPPLPPQSIPPPPMRGPSPSQSVRVGPPSSGPNNSNQHLISYPMSRSK